MNNISERKDSVHFIPIPVSSIGIINLRYYKGFNIEFNVEKETFQSTILSLFDFSNSKDLEKAMDVKIYYRSLKR